MGCEFESGDLAGVGYSSDLLHNPQLDPRQLLFQPRNAL